MLGQPMNLRDDLKQLQTGPRDLRKFGLTVGGVLTALGLLFLLRHKLHFQYFLWPGGLLLGWGLAWPRALKWPYLIWMSAALVMGFVMAHVILTLFFYLIITPVGLLARATGKDFLSLKLDQSARSYWITRPQKAKTAADYERQF